MRGSADYHCGGNWVSTNAPRGPVVLIRTSCDRLSRSALIGRTIRAVVSPGRVPIAGIHGAELRDGSGAQAEAEVLILLADGDLVPVGIKKADGPSPTHDRPGT